MADDILDVRPNQTFKGKIANRDIEKDLADEVHRYEKKVLILQIEIDNLKLEKKVYEDVYKDVIDRLIERVGKGY